MNSNSNSNRISINVSVEQTNVILEALGQLPFVKVYELIGSIQAQAKEQLQGDPPEPAAVPSPSLVESAAGE